MPAATKAAAPPRALPRRVFGPGSKGSAGAAGVAATPCGSIGPVAAAPSGRAGPTVLDRSLTPLIYQSAERRALHRPDRGGAVLRMADPELPGLVGHPPHSDHLLRRR